jgi:hypothetical protein
MFLGNRDDKSGHFLQCWLLPPNLSSGLLRVSDALSRARHTKVCGRIHIEPPFSDLIPACGAVAEIVIFNSTQGLSDPLDLNFAVPICRQGQLLALHGIDPGQPTNVLLIDQHGARISSRRLAKRHEFRHLRQQ